MTASTRRELRSAATSTSTTAIGLIRALTDARPIKPTSTRCLSARRPNPAEAPLIDAEILFRQPQPPQYSGTAYVFSKLCGALSYAVLGPASPDDRTSQCTEKRPT